MNTQSVSFYNFTVPGLRGFGLTEGALAVIAPRVLLVPRGLCAP